MSLTVRDLAAALATVDPDTPVTAGIDIPADTLAEWGWDVPLYVGPIPEGLTIDHLCRNTSCVNPAHMEVVSSGVNTLRGGATSAVNARKTHCHKGHEFAPDNTRIDHKGGRVCVACKRERDARSKRERYAKARTAA